MAFMEDIARIREVLRANALNEVVDNDILVALLQLYESDDQRVDLVILDLQIMLGKDLPVGHHFGMQQQRWEELQRPTKIRNPEAFIDLEAVTKDNTAAEVIVIDQGRPSTSGIIGAAPLVVLNRNKRPISDASTDKSQAKRVSPSKAGEDRFRVSVTATVVNPDQTVRAGVVTYHAPTAVRISMPPSAPRKSSSTVAKIPVKKGNSYESKYRHREQNGVHPITVAEDDLSSKEPLESTSVKFHKATLSTIPAINVKFAAFKATEFITLRKSAWRLEEYLASMKSDMTLTIPKKDILWNPPVEMEAEHQRLFQHVYDKFINEKVEFLVRALPDVDPDFLEEKVNSVQGDEERIRSFLTEILEGNMQYPTRADYNRRKEYNILANKFFTVEEFLELYDNPLTYFRDDSRVTDAAYREEAINQLKKDFRFASLTNIRRVFHNKNYHYTPAYFELRTNSVTNQRKTKRTAHECTGTAKDLFLIQEIAFVALQPEIDIYLKNKEQMRKDAVVIARANGTLLDCPICCEDELTYLDLIYCSMGHGVCRNCVSRQSEELIGLMKNHVPCLFPECTTEYTLRDLKEVLKKSIFCCLEKRRQAEEVSAAGIEGLESCPFCEYCEVPRENDRLFTCKNPGCCKVSCRQCRESNHLPLRCEEFAMKQRLTHYVETKMTEALVRQCPSCKKNFVKADGCNKMVCPCGAIMCYICRQQIKDYNHFSNNPLQQPSTPVPSKPKNAKCPLYSDTLKMHEEEVAKSAARARAELASSNPNIRVDLVLGKN
ncbi:E3 ubiquitin-protein ligase RNF216-like [Daphnia carinata]|uniref:E3 ubiquitin-protein ligase RNF216-like n=1 Tax=Daphnia carinata TaxID=120202 RepID=UPI0025802FB3|nr:E3 ubiquitin-protein ligase RNF216-like [Daphnia carinata]